MKNIQPQNSPFSLTKHPGSFSVDGNKLRVTNKLGMSSVLFEDISSVSFKSFSIPNWKYFILSLVIPFLFFVFQVVMGFFVAFITIPVFLIGIGLMIYAFINKIKWENVIIETRGGLLIYYSVEENEGINQVDKIEDAKRRMTMP